MEPWNFFTITVNSFYKMKNVIIFVFLKNSGAGEYLIK